LLRLLLRLFAGLLLRLLLGPLAGLLLRLQLRLLAGLLLRLLSCLLLGLFACLVAGLRDDRRRDRRERRDDCDCQSAVRHLNLLEIPQERRQYPERSISYPLS